jgi:hypothetical protein
LLKKQYKNVPDDKRKYVNDMLKLYEDGKIFNKITVVRAINDYLIPNQNKQQQTIKYLKTLVKYLNVTPISESQRIIKDDENIKYSK